MLASDQVLLQIEELRRQLHQGLGAQYDPARLQTLVPISQELDRLVVEYARHEMHNSREAAQQ